jgi:hypothetical protein
MACYGLEEETFSFVNDVLLLSALCLPRDGQP